MHRHTHTHVHKQAYRLNAFVTPHLFPFWVSSPTLTPEWGAESSDHRGGKEMYEGEDARGGVGEVEWQHTPRIVLLSPFPSEVLIQPVELQTTIHTYLLLSILLGARWERKWLPAALPPQGSFLHINTFTAWFHLSHTLKTHTQGKPGAVNDGHMQNCAHL